MTSATLHCFRVNIFRVIKNAYGKTLCVSFLIPYGTQLCRPWRSDQVRIYVCKCGSPWGKRLGELCTKLPGDISRANLKKVKGLNKRPPKMTTCPNLKLRSVKKWRVKVGRKSNLVKSSPIRCRPPVTRRCKATHRSTIKKVEVVKIKEETDLEERSKQVIQKPFEEKQPSFFRTLPENCPPTPIFYL